MISSLFARVRRGVAQPHGWLLRTILLAALIVIPKSLHAQSAEPDSAAIYARMAYEIEERNDQPRFGRLLAYAKRALTLYRQRGDERAESEMLALIGDVHAFVNQPDSGLVYSRQAIALLRRVAPTTTEMVKALAAYSNSLVKLGIPGDSAVAARKESIALYERLPDRVKEAWNLIGHGDAYRIRAERDSAFRAIPANLDTALHYYRRGLDRLKGTADTIYSAGALGNVANIWRLRNRNDSVVAYRRRAVDISTRSTDTIQNMFDIHDLVHMYLAPVRDRRAGVTLNLDSALYYSHRLYDLTKRVDNPLITEAAWHLAESHDQRGRQDSARFYYRLAVATARTKKSLSWEFSAWDRLATWYERSGFSDSSIAVRREALRAADSLVASQGGLPERQFKYSAIASLSEAHMRRGNPDSAMHWSRQLIAILKRDSTSPGFLARGTLSLAGQYLEIRKLDSAGVYFRQAIDMANATNQRSMAAQARQGLAQVYQRRGEVDSALSTLAGVIRVTTGVDRALALAALANTELSIGWPDSAIVHYSQARAVIPDANRILAGNYLRGIGNAYRDLGNMDSALVYYRSALAISEEDKERNGATASLRQIANVYRDIDNADSALIHDRRAMDIANSMGSPQNRAILFNNIGLTYLTIGQLDSSRTYLERSIAISRANPFITGTAATLANLGLLRLKTAADDSAFTLLRRALALYLDTEDKAGEVISRLHLARAFTMLQRADSALVHARRAVSLTRAVRNRSREGLALAEVGRIMASAGAVDSAHWYFSQAVTIMRAAGFTQGVRTTMGDIAELLRTSSGAMNLSRSTAYYDSAASVVDNARRGAGGDDNEVALTESQTDLFGGWARAWLGRRAEVGEPRSAASALGAVERGRSQSLTDMVTRLQSTSGRQASVQHRPSIGNDLAGEIDTLLSTLRASKTAALSYLVAGDTLFTWLLSPTGELELLPPVAIDESELNQLVRSSRRMFEAENARSARLDREETNAAYDSTIALRNPDDDWKRLADLLLPTDVTRKVPAGTTIVIVPHGSIGLVPFSALKTKSDSGGTVTARAGARTPTTPNTSRDGNRASLGVRNPLRYAPSFAALRATEQRERIVVTSAVQSNSSSKAHSGTKPASAEALVVGNPTMPYLYSGRTNTRSRLQPLPGAEAESRTVATLLGSSVLNGKAATESAVRSRMTTAPLIHFATHGLAFGRSSGVRRSYVAFASDSTHDGLLTLGELMDDGTLSLKAELVVLSACQTGLGDMKKAEGSVGLQRAFLARGARSVLVSLWNVDDRATRLLMEKFYAYWLDPTVSRTKAESLRMAQDAVRRTPGLADPKYWAAFQLVGAD